MHILQQKAKKKEEDFYFNIFMMVKLCDFAKRPRIARNCLNFKCEKARRRDFRKIVALRLAAILNTFIIVMTCPF